MFFIDKPFVSDFLKTTVQVHGIPVVETESVATLNLLPDTRLISPEEAAGHSGKPVYMNSENAIGWLAQQPAFAALSAKINLFKNKATFRRLTQPLFPDLRFQELAPAELSEHELPDVPFPFIIKPSVGFFSLGVHYVESQSDWPSTVRAIREELAEIQGLYPSEVMNCNSFIVEQCIEGEEYAVDAYFDADGEPVILGVLQHVFSSAEDVSDRVYITSKSVVEENMEAFSAFLKSIGELAGIRKFAVHVELRIDFDGSILPIEVNPMRFGGWCTTADLTHHAFGINPYVCYARQEPPDWTDILAKQADDLFALVVLDNSTGIPASKISAFDYDALLTRFENPLELRKFDVADYGIFGFLMTRTRPDNMAELTAILHSDLSEFVTMQDRLSAAG